ncbi:MAG TPA: hypothetical protein VKG26_07315 [Bacteroidia bacterium]|nr:hypothetical protein [Bacteroidia bacterium]
MKLSAKYLTVCNCLSFKKKIYIICFFINLSFANSAFATLNYILVVSNPGYTALSGGTAVPNFNNGCQDQMVSSLLPIGFTFTYNGTAYTQFEVSDNGELFLGGSYTCSNNCGGSCNFSEIEPTNTNGFVATADRPAICPLWDDLGFNANGSGVSYKTTGTTGNHILTVEWLLMDWKVNNSNSPHGSISFQVVLYESPAGQIDFIYRQESQALGTTTTQLPHAKIGLMGAMGDYYSTDNLGSTPSKSVETTVTAKPATGILLRWTDPGTLPIELLFFKGIVQDNKILLNWGTATETDNNYFTISRSTNAIDFETIAQVKGAGNSTAMLSYNYSDLHFPDSSAVLYYRLQQTDFNGNSSYAGTIPVSLLKDKPPNVYYNRNSEQLVILNFQKEGYFIVDVIDILGRSVFQKNIEIIKEKNYFSIVVPLTEEGVFFAKISETNGNIVSQSKFVK